MKIFGLGLILALLSLMITIFLWVSICWAIGSFSVSVIKATTEKCDTTLTIEKYFDADWFCEEEL